MGIVSPGTSAYAKDGDKDDDRDEDDNDDIKSASSAVERGEVAPLSVIIKIALAHTPGQVIDVKLRHESSSYVYRIKILTRNGRKRELYIDARTQEIKRVK